MRHAWKRVCANAAKGMGVPMETTVRAFLKLVAAFGELNESCLPGEDLIAAASQAGLDRQHHERLLGWVQYTLKQTAQTQLAMVLTETA